MESLAICHQWVLTTIRHQAVSWRLSWGWVEETQSASLPRRGAMMWLSWGWVEETQSASLHRSRVKLPLSWGWVEETQSASWRHPKKKGQKTLKKQLR